MVSWGESTFIQNGINVVNPVDVSRLRVAGAELKEAFLPTNMIWASTKFSDNLSMEAYYQFDWKPTEIDPSGTYFSSNDFASPGGTYIMLGFGTVPQPVNNSKPGPLARGLPLCAGQRVLTRRRWCLMACRVQQRAAPARTNPAPLAFRSAPAP